MPVVEWQKTVALADFLSTYVYPSSPPTSIALHCHSTVNPKPLPTMTALHSTGPSLKSTHCFEKQPHYSLVKEIENFPELGSRSPLFAFVNSMVVEANVFPDVYPSFPPTIIDSIVASL